MLFQIAPLPPPLDLACSKRNLPFFLELAKYHEISVLSYGTPEQEEIFTKAYGKLCKEIRFVSRKRAFLINIVELLWLLGTGRSSFQRHYRTAMQRAISEMANATRYDLIHCGTQLFGLFSFPSGIPISSDAHDVAYYLAYRTYKIAANPLWKALHYLDYKFGKRLELNACRKFDLLITTTEKDCEVFRRDLPDLPMTAISNGAGKSFFQYIETEPEPFTMTFTGLFTHLPNTDGILYFLDNIFPLILREIPQARVYVVGKSPPRGLLARAAGNITITGFVDDVRPYIARSQVFIIPLRAGTGIRGKALEAMAMRRPIVTTAIGVEGIHLRNGESALFAETPEAFAQSVIRLFRDFQLRGRIAENAYAQC